MTSKMDIEIFSLGKDFANKNLRICSIDGIYYFSIFDTINAIAQCKDVHGAWTRMQNSHPDILPKCQTFQFPGQGQKDTPICNLDNLLEIIFLLPGKRAREYRLVAVELFKQHFQISNQKIEALVSTMDGSRTLTKTDDKVVTLASRAYEDTHVYVRVRYPDDYVHTVDNRKELTLYNMKFGIAYSLNDRNSKYNQEEGDNGYMLFSFSFNSRMEAEIVENILKVDFGNITVGGSREYLSTSDLAVLLKMTDYVPDDYEAYIRLAEHLFRYIVRLARLLWPERYEPKGFIYYMNETIPKTIQQRLSDACTIIKEPLKTELVFIRTPFTFKDDELLGVEAGQLQYLLDKEKKLHCATQKKNLELQQYIDILLEKKQKFEASGNPTPAEKTKAKHEGIELPKNDQRTRGKVIGRDIITGEEVYYPSVEQAANIIGYTPKSMRQTIIDQPRQYHGKHWRMEGKPYWIPMRGLQPELEFKGKLNYIKAIDENDSNAVRIFESITSAENKLENEGLSIDRRTITDYLDKGKPYSGFIWSKLPFSEWGNWSDKTSSNGENSTPIIPSSSHSIVKQIDKEGTGKNGRCNGKIIARDIITGDEVEYVSLTRAAAMNRICAKSLRDKFVNKPRQCNGKHFRTIDATSYWQPPDYFECNYTTHEKKTAGYVVSEDADGNKKMYESVKTAKDFTKIHVSKIQQFIDSGKVIDGKSWRKAREDEYNTFVPI